MPLNAENSTSALERIAATKSATQRQANRTSGNAPRPSQGGASQAEGRSEHAKSFAQMLRTQHGLKGSTSQDSDTGVQARHGAAHAAEKRTEDSEATASAHEKDKASPDHSKATTEDLDPNAAAQAQGVAPSTVAMARAGAEAAVRGRRAASEAAAGHGGRASRMEARGAQPAAETAGPDASAAASAKATGHGGPGAAAGAGDFASALQQAGGQAGSDGGLQAVMHARHEQAATPGGAADPGLASLGALAAPVMPPPAPAAEAASTASAQLPMAPDHPEFPAALGVQLSTWVNDGIEHASLELHPQDLGPIEIHIAVKDGQTHVELGSAVPGTREALNLALPQLSAQLDGVGLSLAGGQVFDQGSRSSGSQDDPGAGRSAGRAGRGSSALGGVADAGSAGSHRPAVRQQGLVDFYA
ncbi:flagellar hook-length control protein FliK [Ideonella oryzae]|uniref:Flagellar hook-length control protein FliK n=1 Tax=Ideonella oryzae TaxID=2937441 RepID=A0ABT1BRG8_9BURK|nr:flagellar hook-length control protein FliK [Ideonella oryzae]MCO5978419.1 flagellar hook-length control protein FliK [Ideonella oryzae]